MEFTGERFIPGVTGQIKYEHLHRYAACRALVAGKRVLDIACGEGYGAAMLAETAATVIGVDISAEAVAHAREHYAHAAGVSFAQGACHEIPLPDASVDVVVSFETIEHHDRHQAMMAEVRRVLRPGGLLLISSPNKKLYSDETGFVNPHHVKELYFEELDELLRGSFRNVRYFGQRLAIGSYVFPMDASVPPGGVFTCRDDTVEAGLAAQTGPMYFLAACSDAELPPLDALASTLVDARDDLLRQFAEVISHQQGAMTRAEQQIGAMMDELERLRTQADRAVQPAQMDAALEAETRTTVADQPGRLLQNYSALLSEHLASLQRMRHDMATVKLAAEQRRAAAEAARQVAEAEAQALRSALEQVYESDSWRLTAPLRRVSLLAQRGLRAVRQPHVAMVSAGRTTLRRLPLPISAKIRLRDFLFRRYGGAFSHLPTYSEWLAHLQVTSGLPTIAVPEIRPRHTDLGALALPTSANPVVSIIIPVYGKIEYTHHCLESIARRGARTPFEVIVVDDRSPDDTLAVLDRVQGVRVLRNATNLGFIRSCNSGAAEARGQYLLFLNNDSEVLEGWLDELLDTFRMIPDAGLVGAKLFYPNGTLQEAGGIIWNDGSGWNYGRGDDPSKPEYSYLRDVDYCSGACIMLPRALFDDVGRFDERYVPAYAEDSDLAFKVRAAGRRVLMQPLSRVVHFEGITSGTDVTSGVKAYQVENAQKLRDKWADALATHAPPGHRPEQTRDPRARFHVLVLDHCTPEPDKDAGSITARNLMRILGALGGKVTFAPEDNFLYLQRYTADLQREGIECLYLPYVHNLERYLDTHGDLYDAVLMFRVTVVQRHLDTVRRLCPRARVLFHASDLHHVRMQREAALAGCERTSAAAAEAREAELRVVRAVDLTILHSTAERNLLLAAMPDAKIVVFQWAIPVRGTQVPFAARSGVAFIGGYQHPPNVDAALYFHREILPLLRERIPGVRFLAIGSKPPPELQAIAGPDVVVTGYVEDIESLLDQVRVSVAPLRYGAGIKGKVGTSLACGLPCVATPVAAEGMELEAGEEILIAETAAGIADAIARVYHDQALWTRLSEAGVSFVGRTYSFDAGVALIGEALIGLGLPLDAAAIGRGKATVNAIAAAEAQRNAARAALRLPFERFVARAELEARMAGADWAERVTAERRIASAHGAEESYRLDGYCAACDEPTTFLVDRLSGATEEQGVWIPNWRERLVCAACQLNNRQRLITRLVREEVTARAGTPITAYLTEQVTAIYRFLLARHPAVQWIGSEYLGPDRAPGEVVNGIRHEDVERLSLADASVDLIVSNDVLEHVNEPAAALREFARILRPGGRLLLTIPFHWGNDESVRRARFADGRLEHLLPAQYHGNPVSADGSLVFTDFGWDVLRDLSAAGLEGGSFVTCWSERFGHLGANVGFFEAVKP